MTNLTRLYYSSDTQEKKRIEKLYHGWVSSQPCCVSGQENVGRPHHVRYNQYCGTGMKPPDIFELPITNDLHVLVHNKGQKTFEKMHKTTFIDLLITVHEQFMCDYEMEEKV